MSYHLSDFGNYTVAGRVHKVETGETREINFTRSASFTYDPRGHFAVEHAYVQFFVPENRRPGPPVLLIHGGGMCGSTWETTPDGRPGWVNRLVQRGYEVHIMDNVERGRSGFAPGLWTDTPILRSQEEAWSLFRIGAVDGFSSRAPFPGSLFPANAFDQFSRMLVPRWLSTTPLHVAAMIAALRRIGPALVICHSQGGEITLDALKQVPELFAGMIAIEPSTRLDQPSIAKHVPTVVMAGDYLDSAPQWQERQDNWRKWVQDVSAIGGRATLLESGKDLPRGHSHLPMLDRNNIACLDLCLKALPSG